MATSTATRVVLLFAVVAAGADFAPEVLDGVGEVIADAAEMPFIARNTKLAWEQGKPAILTMDRRRQPANRDAACGGFVHRHPPPAGTVMSTRWRPPWKEASW
ncbi:hypothetical protein [Actinophytocola sp.]|uniref:hypothetical protein n=1 Tax=Actinophytocola sp. TaxID=1872138 RepID=UPI003D6BDEDB